MTRSSAGSETQIIQVVTPEKLAVIVAVLILCLFLGSVNKARAAGWPQPKITVVQEGNKSEVFGNENLVEAYQRGFATASIHQVGDSNRITIEQINPGASELEGRFEQVGDKNSLRAGQTGPNLIRALQTGDENLASLDQRSSDNEAYLESEGNGNGAADRDLDGLPDMVSIVQEGGGGNLAEIFQLGHGHSASIHQDGFDNTARISQAGEHGGAASISQLGDRNQAGINQDGHSHRAVVSQIGPSNAAWAAQIGSGHLAAINQSGAGNRGTVRQTDGESNEADIVQSGEGNEAVIEQTNADLCRAAVHQLGDYNYARISQHNVTGAAWSVVQDGSYLSVTIEQTKVNGAILTWKDGVLVE